MIMRDLMDLMESGDKQSVDYNLLGKAFAMAINELDAEYRNVQDVVVFSDGFLVRVFAGSSLPIASIIKKYTKQLAVGGKIKWTMIKTSNGDTHDYEFADVFDSGSKGTKFNIGEFKAGYASAKPEFDLSGE